MATVRQEAGRKASLTLAEWHAIEPEADVSRLLGEHIESRRQTINLVLAQPYYQLLLVEAPRVEPSELRAAVRWKIKNLIDFHIDDAVIDVFEIPGQQERPPGQAMMYVIAARARIVREQIDLFEKQDLDLQIIDVTEMALRNLAAQIEEDTRGMAMLYLEQGYGIVTLTRQSSLYLSRRIEIGTQGLRANPEDTAAHIALEIQRSLDYYDSHFGLPPLAALRIVPGFEGQQALVANLDEALNLDVALYEPCTALDCGVQIDPAAPPELMLAVGGALRREEVKL